MNRPISFKIVSICLAMFLFAGCQSSQNKSTETPTTTVSECTTQPLKVVSPLPNEQVSFPVNVEVIVDNSNPNCDHWTVFEAQAGTAEIKTADGTPVGSTPLSTESDWMTDQAVTYKATIPLVEDTNETEFTLVISSENPSGEPERMKTVSIPIQVVQ